MTMVDALSRISTIQATLARFDALSAASASTAAAAATATTTTTADSTGTAATFADALAAAASSATTAASGAGVATGSVTGTDIVTAAQKYLGVPYVFGGKSSSGMDCSGLVQKVYADMGISVPRLVSGQMKIGTEVASLADAKPGDLIVTGGGEHILIYAGNHKVIHAPYEGRTVCEVEAYMKDSDIDTIRRVIPDAPATSSTASTASATALTAAKAAATSGTADLLSAALASMMKSAS
ncbi:MULTISPECIES: C40 family peptidase [Cryobacterium]|uniref:NlpC/P60 family protein n=1 Tax=Cryobacterium glucosi TaxID=1259175 RepID=A0ABY2IP14_9MICO|nr:MULTISPECIES: C40 family peptidase [Cryobacterium]MDY7527482.1 C40 family peptidase [Cryobacterium sp. 10C2]MDY7556731.1 C40 family peptidase [Cryobacterium sp. 10C3]MEB0002333.1 C40 family peptidase [Cryobacterium sp. RTC2.1]MEB0289430.1 C40 family peptidase [Cryobacterium sp. 10C2]TFC21656.1 NlpC/P60 family protein [Cryobacterium glucosi]